MQKCLSGCDEVGVGLPPASPSERETAVGVGLAIVFRMQGLCMTVTVLYKKQACITEGY